MRMISLGDFMTTKELIEILKQMDPGGYRKVKIWDETFGTSKAIEILEVTSDSASELVPVVIRGGK